MEFSLARSFACSLSSQCRKLFTNAFVALPSADAVNFGAKFNIKRFESFSLKHAKYTMNYKDIDFLCKMTQP